MSVTGALLFGRYAFAPNRLGYCGPDDHQALFEYVSQQSPDKGLVELERRFEGAYPYLQLIAQANNIPDPFDQRVVEAYWIGNRYLEGVKESSFYESLQQRFKKRIDSREFGWLVSKLEQGARPHHNFHVFEVYLRAGLMNDPHAPILLSTMDACRISWGKVVAVEGADLIVARPALSLLNGKLGLNQPQVVQVARQIDGRGFTDKAQPGDYVSVHWNWACDILSPSALQRLTRATCAYLALANQTI